MPYVTRMSAADAAIVRAFFTAYGCCDVTDPIGELADLGLMEGTRCAHRHRAGWTCRRDHAFGMAHLPYGVFSTPGTAPRVGVRIGDHVLDASAVAALGGDPGDGPPLARVWATPSLNAFLALGRPAWRAAREWLTEILGDEVHRAAVDAAPRARRAT